ncbi:unnamed protein product [Ostreobium quekettii]|uniref:serine C-palmitoyltransferase n=1 Tax=Ostreobium quekettii TaxID=121088 RepID=A0A8S1IQ30_9CHLO|nr:unnamed protein product [Ostreobium quekettii]|eukprot:evm.model.scf_172EXC.2 EVM.evm.TU.scf_172EXC.2   scf_172EXC:43575-51079(+)
MALPAWLPHLVAAATLALLPPFAAADAVPSPPSPDISLRLAALGEWLWELWELIAPGGKLHPAGFLEHKGHLVVEALLVLLIAYLVWQPRSSPSKKADERLTEKEIDQLCEEWQPEPLCPEIESFPEVEKPLLATSVLGHHIEVDGEKLLNMVSTDFLGLSTSEHIKDVCRATINKYGVGSCGPRGFYGTVDVHLQLEESISEFMGTQETIIYSYDMATAASVLPAFANAKDVIVCDEAVHYPIQNGCTLSRAKVLKFKHNDMGDLERLLVKVAAEDKKLRKPLNRRFIVVEAIYHNTGELAPLDAIHALAAKHKYRLAVDESLAIGVLGPKGRGACEHFGLPPGGAEIVFASMGNALASAGGFCTGAREVADHQRLAGQGYCFSASQPPYLATSARAALEAVAGDGEGRRQVAKGAAQLRRELGRVAGLEVVGSHERDLLSPVVFLRLKDAPESSVEARRRLSELADWVRRRQRVLITIPISSPIEWRDWGPAIRIVVTARHGEGELRGLAKGLEEGLKELSKKW